MSRSARSGATSTAVSLRSPTNGAWGFTSRGAAKEIPMSVEDDKTNGAPSFIGKLGQMLQDAAASPFVAWSPSGDSVVVIDSASFAQQVLPRYFKHSNFASFVRQLNLYGFHKSSQDSDAHEFSHPTFRRGNEHQFKDIRRKVASGGTSGGGTTQVTSRSEIEKLMADFEQLKSQQRELGQQLKQKEAEKQLIFAEMVQSKQRQELLEQRMTTMAKILMQACTNPGGLMAQLEGDNGLQQIEAGGEKGFPSIKDRFSKRRRLMGNTGGSSGDLGNGWSSGGIDACDANEWLQQIIGEQLAKQTARGQEKLLIKDDAASLVEIPETQLGDVTNAMAHAPTSTDHVVSVPFSPAEGFPMSPMESVPLSPQMCPTLVAQPSTVYEPDGSDSSGLASLEPGAELAPETPSLVDALVSPGPVPELLDGAVAGGEDFDLGAILKAPASPGVFPVETPTILSP